MGELDEYTANELENTAFQNIANFIKTEQGKSDYEKKISCNGTQLMLAQLTGFEFCIDNPNIQGMIKITKETSFKLTKDMLANVLDSNLKDAKNSLNMAVIVAFAVAYNGLCEDKDLESFILHEYEKQKKTFMSLGENIFLNFVICVAEMSNWVNDMALKEIVYKEIHDFEHEEN